MKYPTIDKHGVVSEIDVAGNETHFRHALEGDMQVQIFRREALKTSAYNGQVAYLELFISEDFYKGSSAAVRKKNVLKYVDHNAAWLWSYSTRVRVS